MRDPAIEHSVAMEIVSYSLTTSSRAIYVDIGVGGPAKRCVRAKEIVQIPAILTSSTGATSVQRARLVNRSWWFHLHIFDDEKRNNAFEEV